MYKGGEANMQYLSLKTGKEETTWHKWGHNIKVDHKKWDAKMQTGFTWRKIRASGILL